jgi:hypothetical protein
MSWSSPWRCICSKAWSQPARDLAADRTSNCPS